MARKSTPVLTGKQYREFAFVTLAVTLTLAIFVDGENTETVAREQATELAMQGEELVKEAPKLIVSPTVSRASGTGFGSDTDTSFGQPTEDAGGGYGWSGDYEGSVDASPEEAMYIPPGISASEWQNMTEEERAKLLKRAGRKVPLSDQERARALVALGAQSAQRASE